MPRDAGIHIFDQLKFITNYILAGCGPEQDLIFELNTDAALDLAGILFGIDYQDILQGFFSPKKGRKTKPARHGRKKTPRFALPDISDEIGTKLGGGRPNVALQRLPGGKYLLPGINFVEGITIAALIVEGVSDIAYDNLVGLMELNPDHCTEFARAKRTSNKQVITGGPVPDPRGFPCDVVDFAVGFQTTDQGARHSSQDWVLAGSALVIDEVAGDDSTGWPVIFGSLGQIWAKGTKRTITKSQPTQLTLSAAIPAGQWAFWGWQSEQGYIRMLSATFHAYGKSGWLDWTDNIEFSL